MTCIRTLGNQQDEMLFLPQEYEILTLFPIRNSQINLMNELELSKLLTCKLCFCMLENAVYLKCSHRFCKKCIEKHIRSNIKKGCPICKLPVLTKRQLKLDPFFADFANITPICPKKSPNHFKMQDDYLSILKEEQNSIKKNFVKKRKRPQSLNISQIEKSSTSKKIKTATPYQSIQSQGIQQSFSFDVNTSSSIEVHEKYENSLMNAIKFENSISKIQEIQQVRYKLQENIHIQRQNSERIPFSDPNDNIKQRDSFQVINLINQNNEEQFNEKQFSIQTSNKYMLNSYYTNIRLKNHPNHFFTPKLPFQEISCTTKTCVADIAALIGSFFNISKHYVKLFSLKRGIRNSLPFYLTVKKLFGCFETIQNGNNSLGEKIDLAYLINRLETLQIKEQQINDSKVKQERIIFYTIQTTKINPKTRYKR